MYPNTILVDPTNPKIDHSQFFHAQVASTQIQELYHYVFTVMAKKEYQASIFNFTVSKIM